MESNRPISRPSHNGFSLIELLISIGIIAILAGIIIVAIAPTRQIRDARNAQRHSDVNTILNAVYQYMIDHEGQPPPGISDTPIEICKASAPTCNNALSLALLTGAYLASIPIDPVAPESGTGTNYFIFQDLNGRISIQAPNSENGLTISR